MCVAASVNSFLSLSGLVLGLLCISTNPPSLLPSILLSLPQEEVGLLSMWGCGWAGGVHLRPEGICA